MHHVKSQGEKQLTDFEFDMLAKCGSDVVEKMIKQRVRVTDRCLAGESTVDSALDYVVLNARDTFYVQRGYHNVTVYFSNALDYDNFSNLIATYSQK